jgi:hypothetical protein
MIEVRAEELKRHEDMPDCDRAPAPFERGLR